MTADVIRKGRHRLSSVQDIAQPPGDPRRFLNSDLRWEVPADTVDYQEFTAAVPVTAGTALALRTDGKVELADKDSLHQFNGYVGMAVTDAGMDEAVHVRRTGRVDNPAWTWQARKPVFVGVAGQLTQDVPTSGYQQSVGLAMTPERLFLEPWIPVVCAESSDVFYRQQGANVGSVGTVELEWATAQDIRDGTKTGQVISPAALKIVTDELIKQYGVSAANIATAADIDNGVPGKIVMAQELKDRLDRMAGGGALEFADTAEIRAGTATGKAISPAALKPILDGIGTGGAAVEYASVAEVELGLDGAKVVTPLTLNAVLNDIRDAAAALAGRVPSRAGADDVAAGSASDMYVSPVVLAAILADLPKIATPAEILAGAPDKLVPADEFKRALDALAAKVPLPATTADITAGTAADKYVSAEQLAKGLAAGATKEAIENLENRVTAVEGAASLQWATEAEILAGTASQKAIDPATLQKKLESLSLGTGAGEAAGIASEDEVRELAQMLVERQSLIVGEYGELYPGGA